MSQSWVAIQHSDFQTRNLRCRRCTLGSTISLLVTDSTLQANGALAAEIAKNASLPGAQQCYAFGIASLAGLPNVQPGGTPLTTLSSEALHFRGGSRTSPAAFYLPA